MMIYSDMERKRDDPRSCERWWDELEKETEKETESE